MKKENKISRNITDVLKKKKKANGSAFLLGSPGNTPSSLFLSHPLLVYKNWQSFCVTPTSSLAVIQSLSCEIRE